jgi:mono/diheme cytochrome c family protein
MTNWVKRTRESELRKNRLQDLEAEFDKIAAWLAGHPTSEAPKDDDQSLSAQAYRGFMERCGTCHTYRGEGGGGTPAPDLTGYGGPAWLRLMLMSPASSQRYGASNTMPAFRDLESVTADVARLDLQLHSELLKRAIADNDPDADAKERQIDAACKVVSLSDLDRELIIRWLLNDDSLIFGGNSILESNKIGSN